MDLFDVLLQSGVFTVFVVVYLIFVRKQPVKTGNYREPGWNNPLKLLISKYAVKRWRSQLPTIDIKETPRVDQVEGWDDITIRASSPDGLTVIIGVRKQCGRKPIAEVTVYVKLTDAIYQLPQHPETAVSAWNEIQDGWSAGGLKIQILEPKTRLRILYNGLLKRLEDNSIQHVTFNFIWTSATSINQHPHDWSEHLAARTLALEPWRDTHWSRMLNSCDEGGGSWMQWGAVQGRFQSYQTDGAVDRSEFLRVRGVKERCWSKSKVLRRSINLVVSTPDGTAIQLRADSFKNDFTECIYGSVRFPNFKISSIDSTDLEMSQFCETYEVIPKNYTINVCALNKSFKLILKIHERGGKIFHGTQNLQEVITRTVTVNINGEHGTGILELGYQSLEKPERSVRIAPEPLLKWLKETKVGKIGYCVPFNDRASACPNFVGGKGASLALLSSMQQEEGYRVPPGFCLTIRALEKHVQLNPLLRQAIGEIEKANENYEESNFKEKCKSAVDLFVSTEIAADVKEEILSHLTDLRQGALEEDLGPDLRFAVRSSAVGEDSETLSAAGQNETILGCVTDDDVLNGIIKCWASMFAFTSAYYRRQNGVECLCGGGVVIQALAKVRAAGVLFTRHPARGDPSKLLITANYGLGESVVSGSVEPDTFIISRKTDGNLDVSKIELGSKTRRVITTGSTVQFEEVPEVDRAKPCLSVTEILKLAQIGVSQEELWGSGRDIEWAINDNDIYLLQARPITSLERWTEEELLHELDFPVMSDHELITFANTGEVLPKPMSPMSYDLVHIPMEIGMSSLVKMNGDGYDKSVIITHNRCALPLYNTVYRVVPKKLDVNIRMIELAIHGHKVADDEIFNTALHRRKPQSGDNIMTLINMIKTLFSTKRAVSNIIKSINVMNVDSSGDDPLQILDAIAAKTKNMVDYSHIHGMTSSASTFTQFIAMTILLEGRSDFTPEECNEISYLLNSGDVLSAEVPHILAKIARKLKESGKLEDFKKQDPKSAMNWLKYYLPPIYNDVSLFLEEHGHRAIMEFDVLTKPWVLQPEEFLKVLMQVRPAKEENRKPMKSDEIIASLKTPRKSSTRKVLRWILPLCHRAVRQRETTKAHVILAIHKLRLAIINLGRLLVRQWYLPNHELVFFFRIHELRKYIMYRDPMLLKKAIQRQQYFPKWEKLKFAEMHKGWVQPMVTTGPTVTTGDVKMSATSVCAGEVVARACVVKDLSEIGQLQQGDILITHSTDIGWSPYFPLLSGIVTELGGLISHGAVIAREYGLPCIVGATGATDVFRTGDTVRLSGTNGLLEKVNVAQEQEQQ